MKKKVIFIVVLLLASLITLVFYNYQYHIYFTVDDYIVFSNREKDDTYGIMNKFGDVIIKPIYDSIDITNNAFFVMKKDNHTKVFKRYDPYRTFYETKESLVVYPDYLLINTDIRDYMIHSNGQIITIDENYKSYDPEINTEDLFKDELLKVEDEQGKLGFINRLGETVIKPIFDEASNFIYSNHSYALVKIGDEYRYVNQYSIMTDQIFNEKEEALKLFQKADFDNGLLVVTLNQHYGIYNEIAKSMLIDYKYDSIEVIHQKYVKFLKDGYYGIMNHLGRIIVPANYEDISYYDETEKWIAYKKDGFFGMIDLKSGEIILDFKYDQIYQRYNQIISVRMNDKNYFLDLEGNTIVQFNEIMDHRSIFPIIAYDNGLIHTQNGKYIEINYDELYDDGNVLKFSQGETYGYVDKSLSHIVPAIYSNESITNVNLYQDSQYIIANFNHKYGIITFNHQVYVNFEYDSIYRLLNEEFILEKNGNLYFLNQLGEINLVRHHHFNLINQIGKNKEKV